MAKFMVSAEMAPGMYRAGVGFFGPGSVINFPDAPALAALKARPPRTELPCRYLIPLEPAALKMLEKAYTGKKGEDGQPILLHEIPGDVGEAKVQALSDTHTPEPPDHQLTGQQVAEQVGAPEDVSSQEATAKKGKGKSSGRASDSK